ncbi:MAG: hypothetical protein ACRCZF_04680 [Gemmataceae bacterium]
MRDAEREVERCERGAGVVQERCLKLGQSEPRTWELRPVRCTPVSPFRQNPVVPRREADRFEDDDLGLLVAETAWRAEVRPDDPFPRNYSISNGWALRSTLKYLACG